MCFLFGYYSWIPKIWVPSPHTRLKTHLCAAVVESFDSKTSIPVNSFSIEEPAIMITAKATIPRYPKTHFQNPPRYKRRLKRKNVQAK